MKKIRAVFLASLTFLLAFPFLTAADTYQIDAAHSSILFSARRLGVVDVYGRFNGVSGSITVDRDNPTAGSVEMTIKTESIDTANQRRDDHLRSPDFFNATQFPEITFRSTAVRGVGERKFEVTGDLTIHGVTRSLTTVVEQVGEGKHPRRGTELIGFQARFVVKRSDFGINYMQGALSDEIPILLVIHAVGQ